MTMATQMRPEEVIRLLEQDRHLDVHQLVPLPPPYHEWRDAEIPPLSEDQRRRYEVGPDGVSALRIPKPESEEAREELVARFLSGLAKLLDREDNWTFLQPLLLSLENCVKCQTCNTACGIYTDSGGLEAYRPTFKAEVLRKIVNRYLKPGGHLFPRLRGHDIELGWDTLVTLAELAYRCTLCRRCAQACPIGVDNALITREIRKLFSQELGIQMFELHEGGTVKQLKTGSSTGLNPAGVLDMMEFAEEDIKAKTGLDIKIPFDREGAEYLVMHNAGEFLSWPENLQAFAIVLEAAGVSWTLSSEPLGYDSVNYGLFYDDVQYSRIVLRHYQVAKKLKVQKLLMGECGHAHKAFMPIADRLIPGDLWVPAESALVLLEDLVLNGKLRLDPSRNDFPVTLHDPCNITRSMGIVEPQRKILKRICPQFREMEPHGVDNYCCGGGSGFAVCQSLNFPDWRTRVAGRMKFRQILEAFRESIGPETKKYVCAPCSNCKGQLRDVIRYYDGWERCGILYGGLVELLVNAMTDVPPGFVEWEFH
ncbi:MAG TPA: (Fe-S)-binding protein [Vicinamibacteria bacterium]|nr:(Fe-S)-binding protein [Vicinamibacteria bacterium]